MRKEHPAFRMTTTGQIATNLKFIDNLPGGVVAYTINGAAVNDKWKRIQVCFNGTDEVKKLPVEFKNWQVAILNNKTAGNEDVVNTLTLQPYSCSILYQ